MCTYVVVLWLSRAIWVGDSPDFRDPSCGTRAVCSTTDVNVYSYAHRTFCHSHKVRVVVPAACLERHRYRRSILTSRGTQRTEPLEASGQQRQTALTTVVSPDVDEDEDDDGPTVWPRTSRRRRRSSTVERVTSQRHRAGRRSRRNRRVRHQSSVCYT